MDKLFIMLAAAMLGAVVVNGAEITVDDYYGDATLTANSGDIVVVRGSGLTAAKIVTLNSGAIVKFVEDAVEIAAPITINGGVTFTSDKGVTAKITGAISSTAPSSSADVSMSPLGSIIFAGGGTLVNNLTLSIKGGTVSFEQTNFKTTVLDIQGGGHMVVCNSCKFAIADGGSWLMNAEGASVTNVLEIGTGGTFARGSKVCGYVGSKAGGVANSIVYVNGGVLDLAQNYNFYLDKGGIVKVDNGGSIELYGYIVNRVGVADGNAGNIQLGTGTLKVKSLENNYFVVRENSSDSPEVDFDIIGDAVIDFSSIAATYASSILNAASTVNTIWRFKEGSKLKIVSSNKANTEFSVRGYEIDPNAAFDLTYEGTYVPNLRFVNNGTNLELTRYLAGSKNGEIRGTGGTLTASYLIADGAAVTSDDLGTTWAVGFNSVVVNNLKFGNGCTYTLKPTADGITPIEMIGTVTLPTTMTIAADDSVASMPNGGAQELFNAAAVEGTCTWLVGAGLNGGAVCRASADGKLILDNPAAGFVIKIK